MGGWLPGGSFSMKKKLLKMLRLTGNDDTWEGCDKLIYFSIFYIKHRYNLLPVEALLKAVVWIGVLYSKKNFNNFPII